MTCIFVVLLVPLTVSLLSVLQARGWSQLYPLPVSVWSPPMIRGELVIDKNCLGIRPVPKSISEQCFSLAILKHFSWFCWFLSFQPSFVMDTYQIFDLACRCVVILNSSRCGPRVRRLPHRHRPGHHRDGPQHRPPGVRSGITPQPRICMFLWIRSWMLGVPFAANIRAGDRLHGSLWDQVCMEVHPQEGGQTPLGSSAGHVDWHPDGQRTEGHLRLRVMGSWWVCGISSRLIIKKQIFE